MGQAGRIAGRRWRWPATATAACLCIAWKPPNAWPANSYQSVLALAGGLSAGRACSTGSFTLSYSDQRMLRCSQASRVLAPVLRAYGFDNRAVGFLAGLCAGRLGEVDVSLALTLPGSLVSAWLNAPGERDVQYFPVYSKVSAAVQRALRLWLPLSYFSSIASYDTLEAALPLVVYQASRPFAGASKFELTYDVLSPQCMGLFFRMAAQRLPKELARVEELLIEAGKRGTAAFYAPKQARNILTLVQRRPRLIHSLVAADAHFVNALVKLGCQGHQLREKAAKDPARAVKLLSRYAAEFTKAFNGKLRRLYGGQAFTALGALMLVEATNALNAGGAAPPGVQAVLRISQGEKGAPGSIEQTLVNPAYHPLAG